MKIGFMLPMFGPMATHENMFNMAQLAEERGFESVWAPDHVIMPTQIKTTYPYSRTGDYIADPLGAHLEPFVSLSYIAGCTRRVRLGFTVIVAPYRNPIVTGKMLASLDGVVERTPPRRDRRRLARGRVQCFRSSIRATLGAY